MDNYPLMNILNKVVFIGVSFLLILFVSCNSDKSADGENMDDILRSLDNEISHSNDYCTIKESRIKQLQNDLNKTKDEDVKNDLYTRLVDEFSAYNADSALFYVSQNMKLASVQGNPKQMHRLKIKRADILAHAGMFPDAAKELGSIPSDEVEEELKEDYFATYSVLYQYLSEYNSEHETAENYEKQRGIYTDSLNKYVKPGSFNHLVYVMMETARKGQPEEAINQLEKHLKEYPSGSREYSILASTLAYIYKTSNHPEEHKRYIALSAISDVKGAVKENMSFREVATIMFEDGDVERANLYLKKSIEDANFYSGMLRNAQSSKMLPVIDDAYKSLQESSKRRLRLFVVLSLCLSAGLLILLWLILKQFRIVRKANAQVSASNKELLSVSEQLKEANSSLKDKNEELSHLSAELQERNAELNRSNNTIEQYAVLFMETCSSAISTLHQYQKSLRILAQQGGSRAGLLQKLESSEMTERMYNDFYKKFDEAILNIYPEFIEKVNALLLPGKETQIRPGEVLNTELRIIALIRIGIEESNNIANFLRCSVSTVYTYRSKLKKRAKDQENFESLVKKIC